MANKKEVKKTAVKKVAAQEKAVKKCPRCGTKWDEQEMEENHCFSCNYPHKEQNLTKPLRLRDILDDGSDEGDLDEIEDWF
jgi:acetyl-CoA carboxylase beta subunit